MFGARLLRGANKTLAGESVSHEMLEAFESAKTGSTVYKPNHAAASVFFPEPSFKESPLKGEEKAAIRTGFTATWTWPGSSSVNVTYQSRTPQPIASIINLHGQQPVADMTKIKKAN
jgi:hypothetical protein